MAARLHPGRRPGRGRAGEPVPGASRRRHPCESRAGAEFRRRCPQVRKGAAYMPTSAELQNHAKGDLNHALVIAKQIDYLGGSPTVTPKPVRTSDKAEDMLRFDLENENATVRNYRERVRQCEALGEYALAESIRQILVQEQEHQIDLATALGEDVPDVGEPAGANNKKR